MEPTKLFEAIRQSWAKDTTDYPDEWVEDSNHERGHCGVSSLVIQDYLGGCLLCCDVTVDGEWVGVHYTIRLPDGAVVDLTSNQFHPNEKLGKAKVVERSKYQPPKYGADRYALLLDRVVQLVGEPG